MAKVAKYLRSNVVQAVQTKEDTYSEILLQSSLLLWLHGPCLADTEHSYVDLYTNCKAQVKVCSVGIKMTKDPVLQSNAPLGGK